MTNAILTGLMLGGMYALIAMGLTLQYGVARIMNLSYGEFLIAAAFASHWLFTGWAISPFAGLALVVPIAFVLNFAIYSVLLTPLVRRAPNRDALEVDSILATFGMMFIIQGIMLALFGGAYYSYSFLAFPVQVLGETLAANRLAALGIAVLLGLALYLALTRTRAGTAIRAVAVDPFAAQLVAIDVPQASALTFALGRRAGGGGRRAGQHVPHLQRVVRRGLHHEGADRRGDGRRRQHAGLPGRGTGARSQRGAGRDLRRSRPDAGGQFRAVPRRAAGQAGRPVRQGDTMNARTAGIGVVALAALALLAFVPRLGNAYYLALAISLLQYTVLATAWGMFSGPTRYVSLATTAFFGVGAYTVAVLGEVLPWPLVLLIAAAIGAIVAAIVGLSTLRLSGVYFVIFTFGLAELIRQLVVWFEVNKIARARALCLRRHHPDRYLLAVAGAYRRGVRAGLADRALAPRLCAAHHRRGRDRRQALRDQCHLRQGRRCSRSAPPS